MIRKIIEIGLVTILALGGCGKSNINNIESGSPKTTSVATQIEKKLSPLRYKGRVYTPVKVYDALDRVKIMGQLESQLYQQYMSAGGAFWQYHEQRDQFSSGSQAVETLSKLLSDNEDNCYINEESGKVRILYCPRWSSRNHLEIVETK